MREVWADRYSHNLAGVGLMTLHLWDFFKGQGNAGDAEDRAFRAGKMAAYSDVLKQITGRRVGTERELVAEIVGLLG